MKNILIIVFLLLAGIVLGNTQQTTLTWDAQDPELTVLLYEQLSPNTFQKLGETTGPTLSVSGLSAGTHTLVAVNRAPSGETSNFSAPLIINIPEAPKGLQVLITVTVETLVTPHD